MLTSSRCDACGGRGGQHDPNCVVGGKFVSNKLCGCPTGVSCGHGGLQSVRPTNCTCDFPLGVHRKHCADNLKASVPPPGCESGGEQWPLPTADALYMRMQNSTGVSDAVNHPAHYTFGKIEVLDAIEDWKLPYHLGNVVKYVARASLKGSEIQDLRKAQFYLNRHIARMEAK